MRRQAGKFHDMTEGAIGALQLTGISGSKVDCSAGIHQTKVFPLQLVLHIIPDLRDQVIVKRQHHKDPLLSATVVALEKAGVMLVVLRLGNPQDYFLDPLSHRAARPLLVALSGHPTADAGSHRKWHFHAVQAQPAGAAQAES